MKILAAASLIAALSLASENDYQNEIDSTKNYCEQVQQGNWPAYDQSINCEEQKWL
jgi:hypothetical protein